MQACKGAQNQVNNTRRVPFWNAAERMQLQGAGDFTYTGRIPGQKGECISLLAEKLMVIDKWVRVVYSFW